MPRAVFRLRRLALAGVVLCAACGGGDAATSGGEQVTLYDAYEAATLNPRGFDGYMRENNLRTPEFHACVVAARNRLSAQWDQTMAACDSDPNVTDKAGCKGNDYNTLSGVLTGMEVAIRTDSTFIQTPGGTAVQLRQEASGPSAWQQSTQGWLPVLRTVLVCPAAEGATTAQ